MSRAESVRPRRGHRSRRADVVDRFSELVREEAIDCEGRAVKQIGDEFMLVFPNAEATIRYAVHLAGRGAREPRFPALRMGAHYGTALYREADYLGATVNIAARVTGQAQPGQLLVTSALREALGASVEAVEVTQVEKRALKGLIEPVDLYLVDLGVDVEVRLSDPVCGMELDPTSPHPTTTWEGQEYAFCSESCRDRFRADTTPYVR